MSASRTKNLLTDPYTVIRRPVMTEKSHDQHAESIEPQRKRYTFEVHVKANKHQIRQAVEQAFGVEVESVCTMLVKPRRKAFRGAQGKPGFTRQRKKAVIRLAAGSKQIELM